jgi:hypothetical protein
MISINALSIANCQLPIAEFVNAKRSISSPRSQGSQLAIGNWKLEMLLQC